MADNFYPLVKKYAAKYGVPRSDILAVINNESEGIKGAHNVENPKDPNDDSRGLMAITMNAARQVGYAGSPEGLFDPETNIATGTAYMRWIMDNYTGTNKAATFSAYNQGVGNWRKLGTFSIPAVRAYVLKALATSFHIGMLEDLNVLLAASMPVAFLIVLNGINDEIRGAAERGGK